MRSRLSALFDNNTAIAEQIVRSAARFRRHRSLACARIAQLRDGLDAFLIQSSLRHVDVAAITSREVMTLVQVAKVRRQIHVLRARRARLHEARPLVTREISRASGSVRSKLDRTESDRTELDRTELDLRESMYRSRSLVKQSR